MVHLKEWDIQFHNHKVQDGEKITGYIDIFSFESTVSAFQFMSSGIFYEYGVQDVERYRKKGLEKWFTMGD